MDAENPPEELEELIEEKVEERVQEELEKRERTNSRDGEKSKNISRRGFLKKIGAGAVGLGALSLTPVASRMTITSSSIQKNGSPAFLDLAGTNAMSADLDMNNYSVLNPDRIETGGAGTDSISFYDAASAQKLLTLNEGGPVSIPNTNLNLGGNQLANFVVEQRTSDRTSAPNGTIWYRTDKD